MNQTYFKWYEFDDNVVRKLIATCAYKSMCSEYERIRVLRKFLILLTHL